MGTARPQFTRGSFLRSSHALTVETFSFNASAVSGTVNRFFMKMMEHYSHIRMEAKRKALEGLTPVVAVEPEFRVAEPRVH
jgi:hypothetical protein